MTNQVTLVDAEVALAASTPATIIPAGAALSYGLIQNKDASAVVYFTSDGSVPSATNGAQLLGGDSFEFPPHSLPQAAVKVFSTGTPRVHAVYG